MTRVAVVAHAGKTMGGGLGELRGLLAGEGVADPLWHEVPKSKKAPAAAKRAVEDGAGLILVWGGDGTVQRVVDSLAGSGVTIGVLPAGTANLFARNLGIPLDLAGALQVALHGVPQALDVGVVNKERFAVMAGAGFDAIMIDRADGKLKRRLGRLSYVWTGARALREGAHPVRIDVDDRRWFEGDASCVLLGSMGTLTGGMVAFPDASPTDGQLEVGVVTADGLLQWIRVLSRLAAGSPERSPLTRMGRGRSIDVRFDKPRRYELDGGARGKTRRLKAHVEPGAIIVSLPAGAPR
jgi:YegS/Rv2252/BmrU family lipid kinase